MRAWVRTSRHTGVSLGPVALLILAPFLVVFWVLYLTGLVVYVIGKVAVEGIEAAARWAENRQAQKLREDDPKQDPRRPDAGQGSTKTTL